MRLDDTAAVRHPNEPAVRAILAELTQTDPAEIGLDDDAEEVLAIDSLSRLALVAAIEERFDVRIPDEKLSELRTMRHVLDALDKARLEIAA